MLPAMDGATASADDTGGKAPATVAIMLNGADGELEFRLPGMLKTGGWELVFNSGKVPLLSPSKDNWTLPERSVACALYRA